MSFLTVWAWAAEARRATEASTGRNFMNRIVAPGRRKFNAGRADGEAVRSRNAPPETCRGLMSIPVRLPTRLQALPTPSHARAGAWRSLGKGGTNDGRSGRAGPHGMDGLSQSSARLA